MVADLSAAGFLVDGVSLADTTAKLTHEGAGLWESAVEDIGTSSTPGRDGAIDLGSTFPPYVRSTMYLIRAGSYDATWAAAVALRRRCKPGRLVTLTRVIPDPDGSNANVSLTASARRQGYRPAWLTGGVLQLDIDWLIEDGPFHGSSVNISSAAGTQSIKGDVRTRKMTVTLAAGAARTVTNTSNGYWFTFNTTVPTGGVVVDVEALTAKKVSDNTDMSAYLSWGKALPFQLDPGSNVITVSAGSASIDYQPAYL